MKKLYENINIYYKDLMETYPKYKKYLSLNNILSEYVLSIYFSNEIPKDYNYKIEFTTDKSIALAREIINSISNLLVKKFDKYINNNSISFSKSEISYTKKNNGKIESIVNQRNTIVDSITLVHEFLHCIHLEKYSNISDEEYYYYTEIIGLIGDFYSILYLINNRKYIDDTQNYLIELINKLAICADDILPFGRIIENNNEEIEKNINHLIKDNRVSKEYVDNLKITDVDDYVYHDEVRYIYSFPIAFIISNNLLDDNLKKEYINLFNQLPNISVDELINKIGLDAYYKDEVELSNIMNFIYTVFIDILSIDKVKKKGEVW